ncbi:MAG: hypothetical protein KC420_03160 [Myxococcales bacterium]|nr:hypothetical protein [Myxococcales bacterium]
MHKRLSPLLRLGIVCSLGGCGTGMDSESESQTAGQTSVGSASDSTTQASASASTSATATSTASGAATEGESVGTSAGSSTSASSESATSAETTTDGTGTTTGGATATTGGDTTTGTSTGDTTGVGTSGSSGGTDSDTGVMPCGMGGGDLEFSYIWISNTGQSTLTKLNTVTMVEEGRYITRPDQAGSPSRTSVNLSGDVVVANRSGGLTKFYARHEDCEESNGIDGLQTSSGANDILPWANEECRAWYTAISTTSNRPVAWTSGVQDPNTCAWVDQKVWTSTTTLGQAGSMKVLRLNGDTGAIEVTVDLPAVSIGSWGAYGGAVDGENNFWLSTHGSATPPSVTRVRYDTLEVNTWPVPQGLAPYGMTVDAEGRAWVAGYAGGVARFTPESESWDVVPGVTGLGLQADGEGRVWVGSYPNQGVTGIDVDSLAVLTMIPIAASVTKGVSIDFYGKVWVVDMASSAYRVDPESKQIDVYSGLTSAYTYSDMTGWGLKNVIPQ